MDWKVFPHGEFERLEDNLWCVTGTVPRMSLRRRMAVVRLGDGRLVLHSAVALHEAHMAELERWGTPAYIVVPNRMHRLDAAAYAGRYPEAQVLCPAAATGQVAQVVPVSGTVAELPPGGAVRPEPLEGIGGQEVPLWVYHGEGRASLLVADAIFNLPHQPGFGGWILRLMGSSGGPRVTRLARLAMVKDAAALADSLRRLADMPGLTRLVPAHGDILEAGVPDVLRRVAADL